MNTLDPPRQGRDDKQLDGDHCKEVEGVMTKRREIWFCFRGFYSQIIRQAGAVKSISLLGHSRWGDVAEQNGTENYFLPSVQHIYDPGCDSDFHYRLK